MMIENYVKKVKIDDSKSIEQTNKEDKIFLDLCSELGLHNSDIPIEGNVRQGMIGNTDVVVLQGDSNDLIIESLRTKDKFRGQGSAANALEAIITSTDRKGIILKAKILPQYSKSKGLGVDELKTFYEKRGFIFNDKNEGVRIPNISLN